MTMKERLGASLGVYRLGIFRLGVFRLGASRLGARGALVSVPSYQLQVMFSHLYFQDEAAVIRYSIVSGEHSGRVEIDSRTGILTLSQSLLENEYRNLVLMVNATDNGDPLMSTVVPVVILVDDINDNPPRFDKRQYR
jgi:hypothetical protein